MKRMTSFTFGLFALANQATAGRLECGPATVELGVVPQGKVVTVERWCKNEGTREVQLQAVQTGCSCLKAHSDKNLLRPGERGRLRIQLESAPLADRVEFAIEIPYRGKENATEILTVTADVRPSVVAIPAYLDLGDFRKGGSHRILVVDTTGRSFSLRQVSSARSEVELHWTPVELVRMGDKWQPTSRGGAVTGYQITVQARPGSTRHSLSDEIQIELAHDLQKSLRVRIVGYSP